MEKYREQYPISLLCDLLGISRSGYYAWRKRQPSQRERANQTLWQAIVEAFKQGRGHYGYRRVHAYLCQLGIQCGRHRVARLMRKNGLQAKRKRRYQRTTNSNHAYPIAPNKMQREFEAQAPNQKWVTDITYIPTAEGWLYLAIVLDLFSRRVVGWAMASHLKTSLVLDALQMALAKRRPKAGLLHHSDRGSQYASRDYRQVLAGSGIEVSMSGRGNCYDNAPAESFFATLKREAVENQVYASRSEAQLALFEYIEVFYNRKRLHSTLHYQSPYHFEQQFFSQLSVY